MLEKSSLKEMGFIKTTDYRPNDPPTTYPPTYVKIEDQILNIFCIL